MPFALNEKVVLLPNIGPARIAEVSRVTKGGNVEVAGRLFNGVDGMERGGGSGSWRRDKIAKLTPENQAYVEKTQLQRRVFALKKSVNDSGVGNGMPVERLLRLEVALTAALAILNEGKTA